MTMGCLGPEDGTLDLGVSCRGVMYCLSRALPSNGTI